MESRGSYLQVLVEFREDTLAKVQETPGVWFRVPLAANKRNRQNPPPLSQYAQGLLEAGLEENDLIGEFSMGSKPKGPGTIIPHTLIPRSLLFLGETSLGV